MEITKYINEIIPKEFNGCVSIKKKGKTVFEKACGYRDLANQIPNTLDTRFATASAGKVFVAVAILQMVEQGKISLQDTIGNIIDIDWHDIDKDITIEQLLTHTSGIPDYFDEEVMDDYEELWQDFPNYRVRTSKDLLPLFIHKPMMYPKQEKFQYNNTGYVVLGMVIEKISGLPFDRYLKENIFDVIGMDSTGYYELDRLPAKCANHYVYDKEKSEYYLNIYSIDVKGSGAGGAFTTVDDIERFWTALVSYQLLSENMTKTMLQVHSKNEESDHYGYGIWFSKRYENPVLPYVTGSDPGVSMISTYHLVDQVLVTVVSNFGENVWKLSREIRDYLKNED